MYVISIPSISAVSAISATVFVHASESTYSAEIEVMHIIVIRKDV